MTIPHERNRALIETTALREPALFSWAETDEQLLLQIESYARIRVANAQLELELVLWGRTLTPRQIAAFIDVVGADKLAAAHALLYDAINNLD